VGFTGSVKYPVEYSATWRGFNPYDSTDENFIMLLNIYSFIANFVPYFVAVATGVSRGKMRLAALAAFDYPLPRTPL